MTWPPPWIQTIAVLVVVVPEAGRYTRKRARGWLPHRDDFIADTDRLFRIRRPPLVRRLELGALATRLRDVSQIEHRHVRQCRRKFRVEPALKAHRAPGLGRQVDQGLDGTAGGVEQRSEFGEVALARVEHRKAEVRVAARHLSASHRQNALNR